MLLMATAVYVQLLDVNVGCLQLIFCCLVYLFIQLNVVWYICIDDNSSVNVPIENYCQHWTLYVVYRKYSLDLNWFSFNVIQYFNRFVLEKSIANFEICAIFHLNLVKLRSSFTQTHVLIHIFDSISMHTFTYSISGFLFTLLHHFQHCHVLFFDFHL